MRHIPVAAISAVMSRMAPNDAPRRAPTEKLLSFMVVAGARRVGGQKCWGLLEEGAGGGGASGGAAKDVHGVAQSSGYRLRPPTCVGCRPGDSLPVTGPGVCP